MRMEVLEIDGKQMPPVKSISISPERIWSKNTGRGSTGKMLGDIVARKFQLKIVFAPMSDSQAAVLYAATEPAFFSVKFRNPKTGRMDTRTMYASSDTYPVYSYVDNLPRYVGVGINLTEQ